MGSTYWNSGAFCVHCCWWKQMAPGRVFVFNHPLPQEPLDMQMKSSQYSVTEDSSPSHLPPFYFESLKQHDLTWSGEASGTSVVSAVILSSRINGSCHHHLYGKGVKVSKHESLQTRTRWRHRTQNWMQPGTDPCLTTLMGILSLIRSGEPQFPFSQMSSRA